MFLLCALAPQAHGLPKTNSIESVTPTAVLDYGTFQGVYDSTYNISYFKSIPFAAPPVGNLRFRAPQPPLKIEGVFNSSVTKDFCVQRTVNGSEDCLYLELYGRKFEARAKKPVLVDMVDPPQMLKVRTTYRWFRCGCMEAAISKAGDQHPGHHSFTPHWMCQPWTTSSWCCRTTESILLGSLLEGRLRKTLRLIWTLGCWINKQRWSGCRRYCQQSSQR